MVCDDMKLPAFHKMSKVSDGQVDRQQLPVKGAIPRLCWQKFLGKVGNGSPCSLYVLLWWLLLPTSVSFPASWGLKEGSEGAKVSLHIQVGICDRS